MSESKSQPNNVVNRGTGAGGANTNKNGKPLEDRVNKIISEKYQVYGKVNCMPEKNKCQVERIVSARGELYIRARQKALKPWSIHNKFVKNNDDWKNRTLHGTREPDDCIIKPDKSINIFECKKQSRTGSVCEKLQTYQPKIENYKERYPGYTINYIYVLDSYFRDKCPVEIRNMEQDNIHIVWDDDENFKETLLNKII